MAYIGPGAGFALAGSFLAVFGAVLSAIVMLLFWPVRRLARFLFRRRLPGKPRFKRVIILGLDGLDYRLTDKLLAEGKLPRLAALRDRGGFKPLGSTLPPISPVAWSSFQTGVNPGKHNIFDFLTPDERTYQPKLSSVEIRPPRRSIGFGPIRMKLGKPDVRLLRKSRPFWSILGDYGIPGGVLRVPVTFPPEKLRGVQLSAMCVPDLRGTQGTFSLFTTRPPDGAKKTGGDVQYVRRDGDVVTCRLIGPPHPTRPDRGPLALEVAVTITGPETASLRIDGQTHALRLGEQSPWIPVRFRAGAGASVRGVCRAVLLSTTPNVDLYVTPVHIDPEAPALPIGYPAVYPIYLAKRQGPFATLGLAEDTWALSEGVLDDGQFLRQCEAIEREREAMLFDTLEKMPRGLCVCVFDGTDRVQHMFWRHHGNGQAAGGSADVPAAPQTAIEDVYVRMDSLVGRVMDRCRRDDTLLMVVSDHGFNAFRRGVDLNRWLEENGYLVVDDARRGEDYLAGVDWSRTKAFSIGLAGVYVNLRGKFDRGIVQPGDEADALCDEIAGKLAGLADPLSGDAAVKRVYRAAKVYRGPYKGRAPDLIVGYAHGYRASWDAAIGRTSREVFHDNTKAWSGDHCVDPSLVPGVLFCNRRIESEQPRLLDVGPTVLQVFGVPVPDYMDGQPIALGEPQVCS
jgi:predicted AlkP superfamily phosphohydrolase/phosphomutase